MKRVNRGTASDLVAPMMKRVNRKEKKRKSCNWLANKFHIVIVAAIGALYLSVSDVVWESMPAVPQSQRKRKAIHAKAKTIMNVTEHPPTIFLCDGNGVHEAMPILASVLPEYDVVRINFKRGWEKSRVQWELPDVGRNNPWDILIRSLTGGCSTAVMEHWIKDGFRGNEALVSGENHGDYMPQNMERKFVIGPLYEVDPKTNKTNDHVLTLTYLQMVWYTFFRPAYDTGGKLPESLLADASLRPRGNATKNSLIYAASNCVGFREQAFEEISKLFPVHYGGKCKGSNANNLQNRTKAENGISLRNWPDNIEFYSNFRFCLVLEHSNELPYMTEKILMAFLAGCVPIYYGSDLVLDVFHPDAFIYYDIENSKPALDKIACLEKNSTLYNQMLDNPILRDGENTIAKYFSFRGDIGGGQFKERIRETLGIENYEFDGNREKKEPEKHTGWQIINPNDRHRMERRTINASGIP